MIDKMQIFSSDLAQAVGLTIIDNIWQGLMVGLVLFLVLGLTRACSSQLRYRISLLALAVMFVWAGYGFFNHYRQISEVTAATLTIGDLRLLNLFMDNTGEFLPVAKSKTGLISAMRSYFEGYTPFITGLWSCGVLFLCIKLLGGVAYVHRLRNGSPEVDDPDWLERLGQLKNRVGINKLPRLLESTKISAPMTLGYIRTVIILPVGMLTGVPTAQLESILIHELIHIKKADYLVNIFQSLAEIIFFYHPATWFISRMIQKEREDRCDQLTVELIDSPLTYARALTSIHQNSLHSAPSLAMSAQSAKGDLTRRILRILNTENPRPQKNRRAAALLVLGLCLGFFSFYMPEKSTVKPKAPEISGQDQSSQKATSLFSGDRVIKRKDAEGEGERQAKTLTDVPGKMGARFIEKSPDISKKSGLSVVGTTNANDTAPLENVKIKQSSYHEDTVRVETNDIFQKDPSPLFYLNGKKTDGEHIKGLDPASILSVKVLKGEAAIRKSGQEGKNGVVMVYTSLLELMKSNVRESMREARAPIRVNLFADELEEQSGSFKLSGKVAIKEGDKHSGARLIMTTGTDNNHKPLLIIDGKEMESDWNWGPLESIIPASEIHHVNVLKGKPAREKYGEKGVNGALEIITKTGKSIPENITKKGLNLEVFPNPSSSAMNIRFTLDKRSKVSILVYDLDGRLIDKVFRKYLNKGAHTINWDTGKVPPGTYILHNTIGKEWIRNQIIIKQ